VRKLLRCKTTRAFLAKDGTWTRRISEAQSLSSYEVPTEVRSQRKVGELEIYFSFDETQESEYDFSMPAR